MSPEPMVDPIYIYIYIASALSIGRVGCWGPHFIMGSFLK